MAKPKILFYDIETSPNLAYVWGKYEQDVIAYKEEWQILSFAWKWKGESKIHCKRLCDYPGSSESFLIKALWRLFNKADIVIAHSGDSFDQKKSRARFLYYGLKPPSPFATVDTLKVSKKYFKLNSNSLNDLGVYLRVGKKVKHSGFDLWLGCMNGDKKSWDLMAKYNKQDVNLLEKVYEKLLPWIERHPNVALLNGEKKGCPSCGSNHIVKEGVRANHTTLQQQWSCRDCNGWFLTRLGK